MLLGHQSSSDSGAQVLVKEACHLCGRDILPTFEESAGEDRYRVGMRLHQLSKYLSEADLVVQIANGAALPGE